jgi:excisionase family DNA binding protein
MQTESEPCFRFGGSSLISRFYRGPPVVGCAHFVLELLIVETLLLKPADAAKALAISGRKLWSLTAGREIPCVRIGKAVRYSPDDLRAWIESQKIPSRDGALG